MSVIGGPGSDGRLRAVDPDRGTNQSGVRQYNERTCLGRMANASDLMGSVAFLASDASRYITGANIPVDGGYTASHGQFFRSARKAAK